MKFRAILPTIFLFLFTPIPAFALSLSLPPCAYSGNCGVCDLADLLSRITVFVLSLLGAGMFALFVVGISYYFIWGRGNQEKVQKGKDLIKGTIYGALFVLIAWQMVNLTLYILGKKSSEKFAPYTDTEKRFQIFGNPWDQVCEPSKDIREKDVTEPNLQVCFSRGDGTPCDFKANQPQPSVDKKVEKPAPDTGSFDGLCIQGECCRLDVRCSDGKTYKSACNYLETNNATKQYFKGYTCKPFDDKQPTAPPIECLDDTTLCPSQERCCGKVDYPFGAPK